MKYALIARKAECDTPENHLCQNDIILISEVNRQTGKTTVKGGIDL